MVLTSYGETPRDQSDLPGNAGDVESSHFFYKKNSLSSGLGPNMSFVRVGYSIL